MSYGMKMVEQMSIESNSNKKILYIPHSLGTILKLLLLIEQWEQFVAELLPTQANYFTILGFWLGFEACNLVSKTTQDTPNHLRHSFTNNTVPHALQHMTFRWINDYFRMLLVKAVYKFFTSMFQTTLSDPSSRWVTQWIIDSRACLLKGLGGWQWKKGDIRREENKIK